MRLIDADELLKKTINNPLHIPYITGKDIREMPTVQAEEIIYCKDCKYNVSSHKCLQPESFFLVPDDDFYCGYAERRTDAAK